MSIKSEYEKQIEAYRDSNANCHTNRSNRLEIEGKITDLPIYRLPIKFLFFNIENGRFAADLFSLEKDFKRKLDTKKPEDAARVKNILLHKYPSETKMLRDDLKKRGQIDPGVITAAGVVINGNRRMAILEELHKGTNVDRYGYLETVILPRHLDETEIYKIEARLQYAKEWKIGYGPVNELLKIKEGIDKGMTKKELAALLGRSEKYIEEHLKQLDLLEAYSKKAWGKIDYKRIEDEKITEQITDVEKNIRKFHNEGRRSAEINRLLELHLEYIRSGCSYNDIRALKKAASHASTTELLFEALSDLNKRKISSVDFKEKIDDINISAASLNKTQKQIKLIDEALSKIKIFQDKQIKITPEIRKVLQEILTLVSRLLKK